MSKPYSIPYLPLCPGLARQAQAARARGRGGGQCVLLFNLRRRGRAGRHNGRAAAQGARGPAPAAAPGMCVMCCTRTTSAQTPACCLCAISAGRQQARAFSGTVVLQHPCSTPTILRCDHYLLIPIYQCCPSRPSPRRGRAGGGGPDPPLRPDARAAVPPAPPAARAGAAAGRRAAAQWARGLQAHRRRPPAARPVRLCIAVKEHGCGYACSSPGRRSMSVQTGQDNACTFTLGSSCAALACTSVARRCAAAQQVARVTACPSPATRPSDSCPVPVRTALYPQAYSCVGMHQEWLR